MTRRNMLSISAKAVTGTTLAAQAAQADKPARTKLNIVVVGGHPDDPETGCGGTMARYAALGHSVAAFYLTRGEAGIKGKTHEQAAVIRTREAEQACKILGARPLFGGQIDGATEVTPARYQEFQQLLFKQQPDLVFTHWPVDTHADHRAASILTLGAWRAADRKFALYFYEVMTGSQTQNFSPTDYVDIEATENTKREACYAHRSQNPDGFYSHHDAMNRFRGMELGTKFAEAFVRYAKSSGQPLAVVVRKQESSRAR